jgi:hypothetical protein
MRNIAQALMIVTACLSASQVFAQAAPDPARPPGASVQQLQRDLETMKQQLQQMQEQIRKQEELIQQLSAPPAPPPPPVAPAPTAAPSPELEEQIRQKVRDDIMREIQPSLSAATRTFPSQFNPAIGLVIDTVGSYKKEGGNFEFRSAELGLAASIDPFARGYAFINGTPDGFEVEEAAIVTTSLPYNLTVKGGRFFADFGRLSHFHNDALPFVNRPIVLDRYVGGESQADGVELSYLAPVSQYLNLTLGAYNKVGADNDRVSNAQPRDLSKFTYLGRAATFINLNDNNSLDLGASYAYTPKVTIEDRGARHLAGIDLTYRYIPLGEAAYRGLVWGTEVLYNSEKRPVDILVTNVETGEQTTETVLRRHGAFGLYSYIEPRLSRRLYPGFLFEWVQDLDRGLSNTTAFSPYITFWASDFQRFRLQYTNLAQPGGHDNQGFIQWTVILGTHVHGFPQR